MDDVHCGICGHLRVFDDNFYPETHIAFAAANNLPRRFGAFTGEKGVVSGGQVDYKLLAGISTVGFVVALELLHLSYHSKADRSPLLLNAAIVLVMVIAGIALSPSSLTTLLAMAAVFVGYTALDAKRRRAVNST